MFKVPLTSKAFKLAESFKNQYSNPNKSQQVYLNVLAVYAVNFYCECLGIETDLEASDSLNSVTQVFDNYSDLDIVGVGKVECRPVLPEDKHCYLPVTAWENRIGYIPVEIDESLKEATLLGFYPPYNQEEDGEVFPLDNLSSLSAFIDCLDLNM